MPPESLPPPVQYLNLRSALLTIAFVAICTALFIAKSASELVLRVGLSMMIGVVVSAALALTTTQTQRFLIRKFTSLLINFMLLVCSLWILCQLRLNDARDQERQLPTALEDDTFPFQFFLAVCAAGIAWAIYYLASITEADERQSSH